MTPEKIIVILCSYQGEAYIAEQLDSILNQSYQPIEIHVSDDCSTDNTANIVESYRNRFSNINFHQNSQNIGFLKNFEASLLRVKGKYIALSDQDDIWHPDKLLIAMEELKLVEASFPNKPILVHSDLELIDAQGKSIGDTFFSKKGLSLPEEKSLAKILGHCGVMGNTLLMNRNLIDKALPFPNKLKYHDYWFALINECYGVRRTVLKPLVKYRLHHANTSNNNIAKKSSSTLPFSQDNRINTIKYLLNHYELREQDQIFIEDFYSYLRFNNGRVSHFIFLIKNGFFKAGVFNKLNAFFRIMTAKYNRK